MDVATTLRTARDHAHLSLDHLAARTKISPGVLRSLSEMCTWASTSAQLFSEAPRYLVEATGPDHARTFYVTATIAEVAYGSGQGRSKKQAEQAAAAEAWAWLEQAVSERVEELADAILPETRARAAANGSSAGRAGPAYCRRCARAPRSRRQRPQLAGA